MNFPLLESTNCRNIRATKGDSDVIILTFLIYGIESKYCKAQIPIHLFCEKNAHLNKHDRRAKKIQTCCSSLSLLQMVHWHQVLVGTNERERVRKAKSFSEHSFSPMFCLKPSDINYSMTRTSECMGLALL